MNFSGTHSFPSPYARKNSRHCREFMAFLFHITFHLLIYQSRISFEADTVFFKHWKCFCAGCAYGGCHACLFGVVLPVVGSKARLVCFPGGFVFGALIGRNRIFQALAGPDGKLICFFVSVFRELIVAQRLVQLVAGNGVFGTSVGFSISFFTVSISASSG